jgi:hypothetical protein
MNIIKLANSIRSLSLAYYVPFQGFDAEKIVKLVQKYLPVTRYDILVALEYIAVKG